MNGQLGWFHPTFRNYNRYNPSYIWIRAHLVGIEVGWCWEGKVVPLIDYTRTGSGWLWQSFRGPVLRLRLASTKLQDSRFLCLFLVHSETERGNGVKLPDPADPSLIAECGRAFWQTSWRFANSGPLGLQMCSRLLSPSKLASSNAHSLRWEMLDQYERRWCQEVQPVCGDDDDDDDDGEYLWDILFDTWRLSNDISFVLIYDIVRFRIHRWMIIVIVTKTM